MVWIRNRSPAKALDGMTPYEALYGKKPDLKGVREWGSTCWITKKTLKIGERAEEGRWIGLNDSSKGHRIYWPTRRTITVEYNVKFMPTSSPPLLKGEIGDANLEFNEVADGSLHTNQDHVPANDQGDQEDVKTQNPDVPHTEDPTHWGQTHTYPVDTL
jgi:hypothetical protein